MNTLRHPRAKWAVLPLVLLLVACPSVATFSTYLNFALTAVQAYVPTTGTPAAVLSYFIAGASCVSFAASERASTDTLLDQSLKITAQCATSLKPVLPAGTPQDVLDRAAKVATAISDMLAHLPVPPAQQAAAKVAASKPGAAKASPAPALSAQDLAQLLKIETEAKSTEDKLKRFGQSAAKP